MTAAFLRARTIINRMQRSIGLLILCVAAGVSCTGSEKSPTGPDDPSVTPHVLALPTSLLVDETYHLTLLDPVSGIDESEDAAVVWSSSNESVATVAAGVVTAKGEGAAQINAKFKGKTSSTSITVTTNARVLSQDVFANGIIGFSSARSFGELDAYIVGPGGLTRVTTSNDQEQFDGWSPNGSRIAILRFPMNEADFT